MGPYRYPERGFSFLHPQVLVAVLVRFFLRSGVGLQAPVILGGLSFVLPFTSSVDARQSEDAEGHLTSSEFHVNVKGSHLGGISGRHTSQTFLYGNQTFTSIDRKQHTTQEKSHVILPLAFRPPHFLFSGGRISVKKLDFRKIQAVLIWVGGNSIWYGLMECL